ncbi:MAG: SRPBCC domain-containing protein [Verrucomicrobiales bacterium]|nr:SRPBCC domain-containing protein [Verrucomicrobiales bacterium]
MSDFSYHLARMIAAPPAEVFRAWTQAPLLAEWWGPHALFNPECEIEAKPGGRLRILMREPGGTDLLVTGTVRECLPERSLHLDLRVPSCQAGPAESPTDLTVTVTFSDADGSTQLAVRIHFETPASRERCLEAGLATGWEEGLDSLSALLRTLLTNPPKNRPNP